MKKILALTLILVLSISVLAGCNQKPAEGDNQVIRIGVSPDPHAKLVALIADDLKEEGIEIKIQEFNDYVVPNLSLDDGELDANFFQHLPYLEGFNKKEGTDLVSIGGVHIEPMAVYSDTLTSFDDIPEGGEVAIPNDDVNGGRALLLLEKHGLIKLKEDAGLAATERDIVENPKKLKFTALEAAILPEALEDVDIAVINGNYALGSGLNPVKDGLIIEDKDSPYVNILVVKKGQENQEKFTKLLNALQSEKIKKYIEENYKGAIVPAF